MSNSQNKNYSGKSANEVWVSAYNRLIEDNISVQESRIGDNYELLHTFLTIEDPRQRWVVSRAPMINPAFAIAEIVWILKGRNDSKFLNYWNSNLPSYAGQTDSYHGAYGYRLKRNLGFDQIENAFLALKNNSTSRQVVLQIWDSKLDLPDTDGVPRDPDIPCNIVSMLKIRNSKLEWMQVMRSNDIILGLPYNIIQFTTLHEIMAGWLDLELGTYNHLSDSLHLYKANEKNFSCEPDIVPELNRDNLGVSKTESDRLFTELELKIDTLITDTPVKPDELIELSTWTTAPQSFRNLLFIICMEYARRNKYNKLIPKFYEKSTNPILKQVWKLWSDRFSKR